MKTLFLSSVFVLFILVCQTGSPGNDKSTLMGSKEMVPDINMAPAMDEGQSYEGSSTAYRNSIS